MNVQNSKSETGVETTRSYLKSFAFSAQTNLWFIVAGFATLAGCTVGPDYRRPDVKVADRFTQSAATQPTTRPVDLARWWETLRDPELNSLLNRAVDANLDLQIAISRLQEARSNEAIFTGSSLPDLEFAAAAARGTGTNDTKGRISSPLNAGSNTTGYKEITQVLGFDAVWEVDLFGHLRREAQVAIADTQAAFEFRNQVLITLLADVTHNYAIIRSLQMRVQIAWQAIDVQERSAKIARFKFQQGLTNQLDVELAERELLTTQATLAPLLAQVSATERNLALLLALQPDDLRGELDRQNPTLPQPPAEIAAGLPGELLRRRPDIRQAEAQLIAANARIGVAVSQLYPQIFLTGGIGVQGQGLGRLPIKWDLLDSVGPSVRWALLDFGTIDSQIQSEDQRTFESLANYRKTILTAVTEVDNALENYDAQRSRLTNLGQAIDRARRAVDIATQRYERGLTDFLYVLDAERALYTLQDQYALSENETVTQFIAVCKALGGGWEGYAPPAPPPAPRPAILAAGADLLGQNHAPLDSGK